VTPEVTRDYLQEMEMGTDLLSTSPSQASPSTVCPVDYPDSLSAADNGPSPASLFFASSPMAVAPDLPYFSLVSNSPATQASIQLPDLEQDFVPPVTFLSPGKSNNNASIDIHAQTRSAAANLFSLRETADSGSLAPMFDGVGRIPNPSADQSSLTHSVSAGSDSLEEVISDYGIFLPGSTYQQLHATPGAISSALLVLGAGLDGKRLIIAQVHYLKHGEHSRILMQSTKR
jgi:hypothetical protein